MDTIEARKLILNRFSPPYHPDLVESAIRTYLDLNSQDHNDEFIVNFSRDTFDRVLKTLLGSYKSVCVPCEEDSEVAVSHGVGPNSGNAEGSNLRSADAEGSQLRYADEDLILIEEDLSQGKEVIRIPLVSNRKLSGDTDNPRPHPFRYVKHNVILLEADLKLTIGGEYAILCKNCTNNCSDLMCDCCKKSDGNSAYNGDLLTDTFYDQVVSCLKSKKQLPSIKECWVSCYCSMSCSNRLLQRGIIHEFEVFTDQDFFLRNISNVPTGSFLFEFVGQVVTAAELKVSLDLGFNIDYVMCLEKDGGEQLYLDANELGNIARFLRRGTIEQANVVALKVFVEADRPNYYHMGIFSLNPLAPRTVLVLGCPAIQYEELLKNTVSVRTTERENLPASVNNGSNEGKPRTKNSKVDPSVYFELEAREIKERKPRDHTGKGRTDSPAERKAKRGR